jgi:hypothetical protein
MKKRSAVIAVAVLAVALTAAAENKVFRYSVTAGASVFVSNDFGPITVRAVPGNQVVITGNAHSAKAEVTSSQNGNRIEVRTRLLEKTSPEDGRVDYDLQVPTDAIVKLRTATGPVKVQNLAGDLIVDADTGTVDVQGGANSHVHVRTVSAPITLTNVRNAHVELTSVGGEVRLTNVTGSLVSVTTTGGAIHYAGDFAGGGEYTLSSHSGDIDVAAPDSASVDISARSVTGSVEDGFHFQPAARPTVADAKSFSGRSNGGATSVRLRTFSGKIKVSKK